MDEQEEVEELNMVEEDPHLVVAGHLQGEEGHLQGEEGRPLEEVDHHLGEEEG